MSTKVKRAKKLDVFVVSEDFLEKCKNNGCVELKPHKLADWGNEVRSEISTYKIPGPSDNF